MTIVTNENFTQEVLEEKVPVLVDFYADWCMPCKMFAPILMDVAEEYEGKLKIVKLNVDQAPDLAMKYAVRGVPTVKLFDAGEEKDGFVGAMSREELEDWINERL